MAIPLYLTTIEQDIFNTFRYLPHAVAVGVGFVTVAAAWKNQQIQKKRKRLDTLFGGDLAAAVHALVSESGCGQSELEQAMKVLEEKHLEAEEYDLYDPYG